MKTQPKNRAERYPNSRYLNTRFAYWPSIAWDGRRIAFLADITGVSQVWQVQFSPGVNEVPWPDQLTFEADRVIGVWYSPAPGDERLIYARDMGGRGIPVEFLVFDDEGHGLAKLKNKLVAYPAVAGFLDRHLRGESVPAGARDDSWVRAALDG